LLAQQAELVQKTKNTPTKETLKKEPEREKIVHKEPKLVKTV
jgi:hypothetical protein